MGDVIPIEKEVSPDTSNLSGIGYPGRRDPRSALVYDDPVVRELRGGRAIQTIDKMLLDPTIAGIVERVELLLRGIDWLIEPASEDAADVRFADFVTENMEGLAHPWSNTVGGSAPMLGFGHWLHEIIYQPDGMNVRWAGFSPRHPASVVEWIATDVVADRYSVKHRRPDDQREVLIPAGKLIHFRLRPEAGKPEGKSLVRNAFLAWIDKQEIRRHIKVGIRRDLTGIPVLQVPPPILKADATPELQAKKAEAELMVREIERDTREGAVLPSELNPEGKPTGWKFELMSSGGRRAIDLEGVWQIFERQVAGALLAEWLLLGHDESGSRAVAAPKMDMFERAIWTWARDMGHEMEHGATRFLQILNPQFAGARCPKWTPGKVKGDDTAELVEAMAKLGVSLQAGPELERHLRTMLDIPEEAEDFVPEPTVVTVPDGDEPPNGGGSGDEPASDPVA